MSDFFQCPVCGEFVNKRNLSEVFEHEHDNDFKVKKEYFGKEMKDEKNKS